MGAKADKIRSGATPVGTTPTTTSTGGGTVQARPAPNPKKPPKVVGAEVDEHGNVTTYYSDGSIEGSQGG